MALISIIIPVFKVECFLHKCVNSVLSQSFKDIEIILVDDGSPDNCPNICDEYAILDSRVKVIHKDNGGSSDARNEGVKLAIGEYLMFLDSDDFWEGKDCLQNLVEKMKTNKADIILYGAQDINLIDNSSRISRGSYNIEELQKNKEAAIKSLFENNHFPGSAWILTIKKSLVLKNKLFFVTGIKAEDIDWLMKVFTFATTFDAVNETFYMYIKNRPGAITTSADSKSVNDIIFSINKWKPVFEKDLTAVNKLLLSFLAYQYITSFVIFSKLNKKDKKKINYIIKKHKNILKYARGFRSIICRIIISIFGVKLSALLLNFVHKIFVKWPALRNWI